MKRQVPLKIIPGAKQSAFVGMMADGSLKVRIAAPRDEGKANEALLKFLSHEWRVPRQALRIVRGVTGTRKVVEIDDHS